MTKTAPVCCITTPIMRAETVMTAVYPRTLLNPSTTRPPIPSGGRPEARPTARATKKRTRKGGSLNLDVSTTTPTMPSRNTSVA